VTLVAVATADTNSSYSSQKQHKEI